MIVRSDRTGSRYRLSRVNGSTRLCVGNRNVLISDDVADHICNYLKMTRGDVMHGVEAAKLDDGNIGFRVGARYLNVHPDIALALSDALVDAVEDGGAE